MQNHSFMAMRAWNIQKPPAKGVCADSGELLHLHPYLNAIKLRKMRSVPHFRLLPLLIVAERGIEAGC